jgi:hypothetical protein
MKITIELSNVHARNFQRLGFLVDRHWISLLEEKINAHDLIETSSLGLVKEAMHYANTRLEAVEITKKAEILFDQPGDFCPAEWQMMEEYRWASMMNRNHRPTES